MTDTWRQSRPEIAEWNRVMATFAMRQIGTSVALAKQQQVSVVRSDYNFEAAVSPDAQCLEHEVGWLLGHLRLHSVVSDAPEIVEAPVSRAYVSRATAAASTMPDMVIGADDFTVVMATRTRFPRSLDVDDEE